MDELITVYKVYVKTNVDNIITSINSSAFLPDVIIEADKWIEIDEGTGDKYHHAQGNYLNMPLRDNLGLYNYKLVDNKPVERTEEDKQPEIDKINAQTEIAHLKSKLADTDYIAAKIAEGAASKNDYAEEIAQRASWRARINELEKLFCLIN